MLKQQYMVLYMADHGVSSPQHAMQEECSSPTKSTAKTPAGKTGRIGTAMHELSVMALQSPLQQACTPGSPASSLHSYTSTKDLIQSIQNRYLEAQSFLKSYKM